MSLGRRERKKLELRQRILDAATTLIARHGLQQTTIDQITESCDIAQATFFKHFASKGALIDALVGQLTASFNEVLEAVDETQAATTTPIEMMFSLTAVLTVDEQRVVRDILAASAQTWSASTLEAMSRTRDLQIAGIEAAQKRGAVRTDRTAAELADAALGLYFATLLFWDPETGTSVSPRLETNRELVADLLAGPATPVSGRPQGRHR